MLTKGLSPKTKDNLESLGKLSFVSKYYLAGGTGLSLHLGHRFSYDLDFFSKKPEIPAVISQHLLDLGRLEILQNDSGSFNGSLNGIKLSFFNYPYPLLFKPLLFQGIKIASVLDIACMKIVAISERGTKRDFIDLFFICYQSSFDKIIELFSQKYHKVNYNLIHILKSLVYFEDAENDPEPQMIEKVNWQEVKQFFEKEAIRLGKKFLIKR
ncbi:hypothetical protein A2966_05095 [Candidatus Roizmanbacteria bacterium RIFCSPLOWO2_01_FULL_41_22]|uniref:Nucleotidyl transferase AbiEii/AbiGii toxin family protein n=1 Tax=Candidatus Roizmanbacteria bacterium RIFCSPLOWO2_01_FULL_41_22 TaxID=1802067 RepID=A0A1F7J7U2_9BACT|nr:MAG: hypothetical protein A2966_05095 [Candidatus Roizmanbacteria bacterium RIFCSPLOWO2_01_FULL_41_22]